MLTVWARVNPSVVSAAVKVVTSAVSSLASNWATPALSVVPGWFPPMAMGWTSAVLAESAVIVTFFPESGSPNWSSIVTLMSVWVCPSAGEVVFSALTVDTVADGAGVWKLTVTGDRERPSVVSSALRVTLSVAESVTEKVASPLVPVRVGAGPDTVALDEDGESDTALSDTGCPPEVRRVTTTDACPPTGAMVGAVTVDVGPDTMRLPNVTLAVFVRVTAPADAVKVTVSFAESEAVNVATPDEFVTLEAAVAGAMSTVLPVPARVTVCPATG